MPGRRPEPDDLDEPPWENGDDGSDDPEGPDEYERDDDDSETPTVPCPACGRPVPEFVDRCPYCGDWIVPGAGPPTRRSRWLLVAALLALAAVAGWYLL